MCDNNCSNLRDMDQCRLPEQVLIVKQGLNQPETMLEQHQPFISEKKTLFLAVFVLMENCMCVIITVEIFKTWKNVDFLNKC